MQLGDLGRRPLERASTPLELRYCLDARAVLLGNGARADAKCNDFVPILWCTSTGVEIVQGRLSSSIT